LQKEDDLTETMKPEEKEKIQLEINKIKAEQISMMIILIFTKI